MSEYIQQLVQETARQQAEDDARENETMVRIAESRAPAVDLIHETGGQIDRSLRIEWRVNKKTVIEELADGLYTITDWHRLDLDGLARVAAVIDAVLMDARANIRGEG